MDFDKIMAFKVEIAKILSKKLLPLFQQIHKDITLADAHNKVMEYEALMDRGFVENVHPQQIMQNVYDALMTDLYNQMQKIVGGENEDEEMSALASLANELDKKGFFEEANEIDSILISLANSESVPTNKDLWEKAKAAAKRKFKVWPSAYASAFAAKWYKDKGGGWRKKKKKKSEMILGLISIAKKKKMKGGLGEWFREEWVDISRKDKDGKHPPCGRDEAKTNPSKYPKCRPKSEAKNMSKKEKQNAVREKRRKEKKDPKRGKGNKPTRSNHKKRD